MDLCVLKVFLICLVRRDWVSIWSFDDFGFEKYAIYKKRLGIIRVHTIINKLNSNSSYGYGKSKSKGGVN